MKTEEIYELVEAKRLELGLSQLQLGQLAFGRADSSAIQNLKRGSSPTFDRLAAIAGALGLELYLGPPRGPGFQEEPTESDLSKAEGLRSGYVPIPWHELARRKHRPPMCIDQGWIDRHGLDTAGLSFVQPSAVNMRPAPAELVALIDRSARTSPEAQTWAFIERGTVTVGVIQNERQALIIHGAEHGASMRLVADKEREAIRLLGRVVWTGQVTLPAIKG